MRALSLFLCVLLLTATAAALPRTVDGVAAAIGKSQPKMPLQQRRSYAELLLSEGKKRQIDPFTIVALVRGESHWMVSLVGGKNNQCIGLGQHCLFKYKKCLDDYESEWCLQKKAWLLNGHNNLLETMRDITGWRKWCGKQTGKSALLHRWLFCYGGYNVLKEGKICGMQKTRRGWVDLPMPKQVKAVIAYRQKLINSRR
jgi:hypothetical protein